MRTLLEAALVEQLHLLFEHAAPESSAFGHDSDDENLLSMMKRKMAATQVTTTKMMAISESNPPMRSDRRAHWATTNRRFTGSTPQLFSH